MFLGVDDLSASLSRSVTMPVAPDHPGCAGSSTTAEETATTMPERLTEWPRPYYERPGGQPFLFYAVFGEFDVGYEVGSEYRTLGVHPSLRLDLYNRQDHTDFLSRFRAGYLWDELAAQEPALARRIAEADQCLILRGELGDRGDLNYLRDSVGLLTFFLDHGGVCVYDPQMFRWWEPGGVIALCWVIWPGGARGISGTLEAATRRPEDGPSPIPIQESRACPVLPRPRS